MPAKLDCARIRPLIEAAVDGELDASSQMSFDEHLTTCPECARAHGERLVFVCRLRAETTRFTAPESLRVRLAMELPQPPKAKTVQTPPHRWRWLTGGAWITSAIALTASLLMFVALPSQQDMLMHELVAAHIRSLMPGHLMDVPSSDQHTVKPWFNGKASLSPPVPNLADQGFPLVGGRLDYVEDQTAAVLIYRRNQHVINLFVWKDPKALEQAPYVGERNGYSLETWTKAGLRFAAVSDVALADLKEFQHLWVKAATAGDAEKTAP